MAVTPNSIITPQAPKGLAVLLPLTANTTYVNPTTNILQLLTAGPNGSRVTKLNCIPCTSISPATQIQLFRSQDGGVTKRLSNSVVIPVFTISTAAIIPQTSFGYSDANPMILAPNEILYMGVGLAGSQINAEVEWADY